MRYLCYVKILYEQYTKIVIMKQNEEYKYSILSKLKKLPMEEYEIARKRLPIALNVAKITFDKYLYIKVGDKNSIPVEKLSAIASFLKCNLEELLNEITPIISHESLKELEIKKKEEKFNIK